MREREREREKDGEGWVMRGAAGEEKRPCIVKSEEEVEEGGEKERKHRCDKGVSNALAGVYCQVCIVMEDKCSYVPQVLVNKVASEKKNLYTSVISDMKFYQRGRWLCSAEV